MGLALAAGRIPVETSVVWLPEQVRQVRPHANRLGATMDGRIPTRMARTVFFSGNPELRGGVETAVRTEPGLSWGGWVSTVDASLRLCESDCPDVLLIDSRSDPGWKLCLMLTGLFPALTVVALLDDTIRNPVDAAWALLHRANGVIGVDAEPERLGTAVREALRHGRYVDSEVEVPVVPPAPRGDLRGKPLSAREFEVLELIADGRTAEQIGNRLGISPDTVRTHVYRILRKLGARDRAHAVALSFKMALLPVNDRGPEVLRFERPT